MGLSASVLKVVGIPRHESRWIRTIVEETRTAEEKIGEQFILVISRPAVTPYFPPERKRRALEDIKRLAFDDLGVKVVVKLHPKEHHEGLYEGVFGLDSYGDRWVYSKLHAFVLGPKSLFAISFYSGVAVDMVRLRTPIIERLDLRGIPECDNVQSLRDAAGAPVFSYRYLGLVIGASDYWSLKRSAGEIIAAREKIVARLMARYRELFPSVDSPIAVIAKDVMSRLAAQ